MPISIGTSNGVYS